MIRTRQVRIEVGSLCTVYILRSCHAPDGYGTNRFFLDCTNTVVNHWRIDIATDWRTPKLLVRLRQTSKCQVYGNTR